VWSWAASARDDAVVVCGVGSLGDDDKPRNDGGGVGDRMGRRRGVIGLLCSSSEYENVPSTVPCVLSLCVASRSGKGKRLSEILCWFRPCPGTLLYMMQVVQVNEHRSSRRKSYIKAWLVK
jgi:hypothetical protein